MHLVARKSQWIRKSDFWIVGFSPYGSERDRTDRRAKAVARFQGTFCQKRGVGMRQAVSFPAGIAACGLLLAACVSTSVQEYADLERPAHPIGHIAAVAPPALVAALASEA